MRLFELLAQADDDPKLPKVRTRTRTASPTIAPPSQMGQVTRMGGTDLRRAASRLPAGAAGDVTRRLSQFARPAGDPVDVPGYGEPEGGVPEPPPETTNLPAVRNTLPVDATLANLKWHPLPTLPGYRMWIPYVRDLFQNVFAMTPEKIKVATTLTSDVADIQKAVAYIRTHGQQDDDFDLEMFNLPRELFHISQGYVYLLQGETYLILEERLHGTVNYYVYTAPQERERTMKLGRSNPAIGHG